MKSQSKQQKIGVLEERVVTGVEVLAVSCVCLGEAGEEEREHHKRGLTT